jgi:hypothetical protein
MADLNYFTQLLDSVGGAPTPFGRMSSGMFTRAGNAFNTLAPSSDQVADTLGAPADALAYILRRAGLPASQQPAFGSQMLRDSFAGPSRLTADNIGEMLRRHPFYQLYMEQTQQPRNALAGSSTALDLR